MKRKLFCEYGPIAYKLSFWKETIKKDIYDKKHPVTFSTFKSNGQLPYVWAKSKSILIRDYPGVDLQLQKNKVKNLELACKKIDGLIIGPNEVFSFWQNVGKPTKKDGYLDGLMLRNEKLEKGIGGGLCQLTNLIHYLVLHTPLTVTEVHHHTDALFPDINRTKPFGIGTSIVYKTLDYRFMNPTINHIQLHVYIEGEYLYGEIRSVVVLRDKYELIEEDNRYEKEDGIYYRNSNVYRNITKQYGETTKELILKNHSKVLFDYDLIPK